MFARIAVFVATAAVAHAASSASGSASASAASASSTANPYIPTSASAQCQTFLSTLNTDSTLSSCTSSLKSATSAFAPALNSTTGSLTSSTATKAQVSSTLTEICAETSSACPQSLLTTKLADFYAACGPELMSAPVEEVKLIYDTFYTVLPFLSAICTKDGAGNWCVTQANGTSSSTSSSSSPAVAVAGSDAYMPNASTLSSLNILFLYLSPSLSSAQLCTACTAAVLKSYLAWEQNTNYAIGLAQSTLISGQPALYSAVQSTCGADFLSDGTGAVAQGGLGQGSGQSGAGRVGASVIGLGAVVLGAVALL